MLLIEMALLSKFFIRWKTKKRKVMFNDIVEIFQNGNRFFEKVSHRDKPINRRRKKRSHLKSDDDFVIVEDFNKWLMV